MMRSLFAGVSGLRNHQTRMDVIGNNIANVNTVGFKGSRVNFQDVLSQTVQGASSAQGNRGGTNPMQIGMGMGLASIDTVFTDGSYQPTGKQTDLSIQGQGFFIISDGANQYYTRAGGFDFDTSGNYLVPGTGFKVMGWARDAATNSINTTKPVSSINIPVGQTMKAQATTKVKYENNLSADAVVGATSQKPASITTYDNQGNAHKLSGTFEKTGANTWEFTPAASTDGGTADVIQTVFTITFDSAGKFVSATTTPANTPITITPKDEYAGAGLFTVTPDFSSLTQYGGDSTVQAIDQDGYAAGSLDKVTIDPSGVIVGGFTNGKTMDLAKVALATFNNPGGLNKVGTSLYARSNNSGEPQIGEAGSGGRGSFTPGSLEMSNVDLAQEFSNMIITQRGFQANSKIISTTDEMLQELANLKR